MRVAAAAAAAAVVVFLARKAFVAASTSASTERAAADVDAGRPLPVRLTKYWPYAATESERRMEGGVLDRRGKPLHTLEDHLADPAAHPYGSLAGDPAVFPYGQALRLDPWPGALFRVVDTGGAFRGPKKRYRRPGEEPLDVCVKSKKTAVPSDALASPLRGDHLDKSGRGAVLSVGGELEELG